MTPLLTIFYVFLVSLLGIVTLFWYQIPKKGATDSISLRKNFWFVFDLRTGFRAVKTKGISFGKKMISKSLFFISGKVKNVGIRVSEALKKKAQKIHSTR
jgi:hypothetical protein